MSDENGGEEPAARKPSSSRPVRPPGPGRVQPAPKPSSVPAPSRGGGPVPSPAARAGSPAPDRPRVRPAAPVRPTAPLPPTPAVQTLPVPETVVPSSDAESEASSEAEIFDDDAVIVPAPDASAFIPKKAPPRPVASAKTRSLHLKRTIIPTLLVNALALPALAGLWYLADPDAPIRGAGPWLPIALASTGVITAALAAWHVVAVKRLTAAK